MVSLEYMSLFGFFVSQPTPFSQVPYIVAHHQLQKLIYQLYACEDFHL